MKKKYLLILLFFSVVLIKAQLPLTVDFNNSNYTPLLLRYGPNDNPAQQDVNFTVRVTNGKAHFVSPSSTAQVRLTGFLDLPTELTPIAGSMNHRWTFTNVADFNVLGANGVAGCYIRGDMNHWSGGLFGDYWFGMIVTATGKVSGIRQGSTNLQTEPFTATDSVSYEIRKIGDNKLQLWAKYDTNAWHQVAGEITITLNATTQNASYNVAVTHVRIMNNNGNAVDVSVDNMMWWQPSPASVHKISTEKAIIYPCPAKDFLYLKTEQAATIEIYDVSGKLLLDKTLIDNKIDVSHLNAGIYVLKVISPHSVNTHKFTKK
jgi:hypothetical protein